jgi:hypothetical protein
LSKGLTHTFAHFLQFYFGCELGMPCRCFQWGDLLTELRLQRIFYYQHWNAQLPYQPIQFPLLPSLMNNGAVSDDHLTLPYGPELPEE